MGIRTLGAASLVAGLCLAGSSIAQGATDQRAITVSGTGEAAVQPADRNSERSIRTAVDAAHQAAIPLAIASARAEAQAIARSSGLSVGPIQAVSELTGQGGPFGPPVGDVSSFSSYGAGSFSSNGFGSFGPGRFCGVVPTPIFARAKRGRRPKLLRVVRHRRCFVPPYEVVQLGVTFSVS